ncbi:heme-degrading monooxygenase HmoA [Pelomonas saccharophila]|uniref:Heme-degrading monooxygenase HmoA n=1 Tax=Roseateles saccharophilus TaxID=304 RepID=A0ABU1YPT1_ROSSA|nr:antibiotic biosynthesis monooxygenase [Roseateles saccharophilus]MDR7270216.1 heme-degrading monooxygenase HmoA [Roseateles saccharophilus]
MSALPTPPYYAVIFTSQRTPADDDGYGDAADRMVALAFEQPGYLGVESARGEDGLGITVSYWRSPEDIAAWRRNAEHKIARDSGRSDWYQHYTLRVAKVERAYAWAREDGLKDPQA